MSLGDWSGFERFMNNEEGAWLHMSGQNMLESMEQHQEALDQVQQYRDAYMMAYGIEDEALINPDTKYSTSYMD